MATESIVDDMMKLLAREREAIVRLDASQIDATARDKQSLAERLTRIGRQLTDRERTDLSRGLRRNHALLAFAQRCLEQRTQRGTGVGLYTAHGRRAVAP